MKRSSPLRRKQAMRGTNAGLPCPKHGGHGCFCAPVVRMSVKEVRGLSLVKDYRRRLDALCREVVMLRDNGTCKHCGARQNLQWAHVKSRRYLSTRWRLENSLILCAGDHLFFHHNPLEFARWFNEVYPDRANLLKLSSRGGKVDAHGTWLWLMAEKRRLQQESDRAIGGAE